MALCPICHSEESKYTNNPIKTPNGLAGESYKGVCPLYYQHIKELQDERETQEIENLNEEDRTTFTPVDENIVFFDKKHVFELRQSTEKLLGIDENTTLTERADILKDYFTLDEDGNYLGTFEYISKADKEEWTDINLIAKDGDNYDLPYLPDEITFIKAIHIEDLRHPISIFWRETWNGASFQYMPGIDNISVSISGRAPQSDDVDFKIDADNLWKGAGLGTSAYIIVSSNESFGEFYTDGVATITIKDSFAFSASLDSYITSEYGEGDAGVGLYLVEQHNLPQQVIKPNSHFRIYNAIYDDNFTCIGASCPSTYVRGIKFTLIANVGYPIIYYLKRPYVVTAPNGIEITEEEFEANPFDRNLYDDYINIWGELPDDNKYIKEVRIEIQLSADCQVDTWGYDIRQITDTLDVSWDRMEIKYINP